MLVVFLTAKLENSPIWNHAVQRNRTSYSVKSHGFQDRFRPFGYTAFSKWAVSRVVTPPTILFAFCICIINAHNGCVVYPDHFTVRTSHSRHGLSVIIMPTWNNGEWGRTHITPIFLSRFHGLRDSDKENNRDKHNNRYAQFNNHGISPSLYLCGAFHSHSLAF